MFNILVIAQIAYGQVPAGCPKYMCNNGKYSLANNVCKHYESSGTDLSIYLQPCTDTTLSYCPIDATPSGGDTMCEAPEKPVPVYSFPGEGCATTLDCAYGTCQKGICKYRSIGDVCNDTLQCNPGLYCKSTICTNLIPIGSTGCQVDTDCVNTAYCDSTGECQ